jgi:hypothetical protein
VDRQQPDDVRSLLLGNRLELRRADRVLLGDEAHEALHVRAAQLLVRAREPRQLPQVGVAPPPVPLRQHGEVVVVLGDDSLAEPLERERRRLRREPTVALAEGLEEPQVPLREPLGQLFLEPAVERALRGVSAQQHERVVGDANERRREHRDQRLVVVAVVEEA